MAPSLLQRTFTACPSTSLPGCSPIPVLHQGRPAGQATLLDAYANTRVKRTRATNRPDETTDPAPEPDPSPLKLRTLRDPESDS